MCDKAGIANSKGSRMKKILFFLPLLLFPIILNPTEIKIKLESPVIKIADGSFINADRIEFIRKLRRTLLAILLGEQLPNGQRKGDGIQHLAHIERELDSAPQASDILQKKKQMKELLMHAKEQFSVQLNEFLESGRGAKKIIVELIQEDCLKRGRADSKLLDWAKTKEGDEPKMFEEQINSFGEYYHFCTDLVNFLFDLTHSCPKAEQQFKDRVTKWSAVKKILPIIMKKAHVKIETFNEIEFLKYLKERYLDKIVIDEISPQLVLPLLMEYVKHTTNA